MTSPKDAAMPRRVFRSLCLSAILAACCLVALGDSTAEIRIHNASSLDFSEVSVNGVDYGNIAAGATSADHTNGLGPFNYASMKLTADGRYITGQTLNMGADKFTTGSRSKITKSGTWPSRSSVIDHSMSV